ncbi:MAG: hypothetical protein E7166_04315 [Firmicutes bacterium]|nr:hypothetical protein [Bacillota bacterium]
MEIVQKIIDNYNKKNYKNVLKYFDEYLKKAKNNIDTKLLDIYIDCQISLGMFENAYKNTEMMKKLFPEPSSNLINKYIQFGKIEEAKEMISTAKLPLIEYYYIAKICFLWEIYDLSESLFKHFLSMSNNSIKKKMAYEYLRKIKQYKNNEDIFHETDYIHFKLSGKSLEPGHIIYTGKLLDTYIENRVNTDPKKENRPYMIWKIIDNKIYAFAVSSQTNSNSYTLYYQKYPNYTYDRKVKHNLVCIEEKDVEKIMDKLTDTDYKNVVHDLYYNISFMHDFPKQSAKFFMETIIKEMNIKQHDIISINDFDSKSKKLYFVIDIDHKRQKYKAIQVKRKGDEDFEIESDKLESINMSTSILGTIHLEQKQINDLLSKIPNNYVSKSMLGTIVEVNSKKLQIMLEEDECYICLDKTCKYSSSYVVIEFIKKNIPLFVIDKVDDDTYKKQLYDFITYLKVNSNDVHKKKLLFYKNNR